LGCVGLRRKKYYIFNKEYSREEFLKKKAELFGKNKNPDELENNFRSLKQKYPHKYAEIEHCENCAGDHLISCKNCNNSFDLIECEDCNFCALGLQAKDCMDCTGITPSELCYESVAIPENYLLKFCAVTWPKSSCLEYCIFSRSSQNCFGNVSLHRNEFCILNKQYSRDEYNKILLKIKDHLKKTGEYGEFFPIEISPFNYNETLAQDYYPLEKDEVLAQKWRWFDKKTEKISLEKAHQGSYLISEINDNILKEIFICKITGSPYRIVAKELAFYRKMDLPLPEKSPLQRHRERMLLRNPRKIWPRKCEKCGQETMSSYRDGRPEKIYCEKCYLDAVY
jgi:hypothetical protein